MSDSEKTVAAKTLVESLNKDREHYAMLKDHLSKFLFMDRNLDSPHYARAQVAVKKLKTKLEDLELQIKTADQIWFGYQLEDLEAELSENE